MTEILRLSWLVTVRNWRVYKKYLWSNILPTFAEPIFLLLSMGVGLGAYVNQINGISYGEFMGPGLAASAAMMTAFFESSYGFYVRLTREGIYKAMMTTPISPTEIITGEILWVSLKGAVMSSALFIVFTIFGATKFPTHFYLIPVIGASIACACGCLGLMASALIKNISQFQTVYTLVIAPLFYFSGILFPLQNLHPALQVAAHFSPLYHGVVMCQQVMWNRIEPLLFLQHFAELIVYEIVLFCVSYTLVYRKLYR